MAASVFVRDLAPQEGQKLWSIIRRGSGSVVRWRRAQIVLWSAQAMSVSQIAEIAFTFEDRVREVIHFNVDGFESLAPKYAGGRPPTFTLPQRRQIKKIALARQQDHDLPFSTWSLSKLAEFLVAEGVVDDISHEGLRVLLRAEGVSFQVIKTFKQTNDPDFEGHSGSGEVGRLAGRVGHCIVVGERLRSNEEARLLIGQGEAGGVHDCSQSWSRSPASFRG